MFCKCISALGALTLLLAVTACSPPEVYHGRVVGVTDGDTITLLTAAHRHLKIRLAEIDTPEKNQPYGQRAKQALSDLVFNQEVRVDHEAIDQYQRIVGHVHRSKDNMDINAAMVRAGHAWVYRRYSHSKALLELEAQARASGRGLWALPARDRMPPWEWRRSHS